MTKALLSIVVPLYNGGNHIRNLIKSIFTFNEDVFPFEIILVNDGSTDNTAELCQVLLKQYPDIQYVEKENGGIASARNVGLEHASGKYVTFADQDDVVIAGYKQFVDRCINENLDMLITSPFNKHIDEDKINKRQFEDLIIDNKSTIKKIAGKLIDGNYLSDKSTPFISTSVWNVLYRREILLKNDIHFKAFIDYEDDWIFNIETLIAAEKIVLTSEGYYCWMIREGSESHRSKYIPDLLTKRKRWMSWIMNVINSLGIDEETENAFVKNVLVPRNIMMCFNNACWHENAEKKERIREIEEVLLSSGWDISSFDINGVREMSSSNRFLLCLLKNKHVKLAYSLNRILMKNHFH